MNPAYIMPAVIVGAVLVYFLYYAINKIGLETFTTSAVITAKNYTAGSTSYVSRQVGGQTHTQPQQQPDFFALSLDVENEPTVALVTKDKFDRLEKNDRVQVKYRRTRITGKIEVLDVF